MADIFVSYSHADRDTVANIVTALEAEGWSVWWDTRLRAGEQWDEVIEREINAAHCVVVVWSPLSVTSHWVKEEANFGLSRNILVPVAIEGAKPPLGFTLTQAADLTGWDGSAEAPALRRALDDIRAKLQLQLEREPKPKPKESAEIRPQLEHKPNPKWWWWHWALKHRIAIAVVALGLLSVAAYSFRQWRVDNARWNAAEKAQAALEESRVRQEAEKLAAKEKAEKAQAALEEFRVRQEAEKLAAKEIDEYNRAVGCISSRSVCAADGTHCLKDYQAAFRTDRRFEELKKKVQLEHNSLRCKPPRPSGKPDETHPSKPISVPQGFMGR